MIDLNGSDFKSKGTTIFNNGVAGLVKNVEIKIERKEVSDLAGRPDYKLIVTDDNGGIVNQGFYYFTPNEQADAEYNTKRSNQEVSRVLHIARAVMGNDYDFPSVGSPKEAYDVLFKLVNDNVGSNKFNVFATFGTISRPNKKGYIGLRYFNFIEPATESSRFRTGAVDLMTRVEADAPSQGGLNGEATTKESWI